MELIDNEGGGQTVRLTAEDSLDAVPAEYRGLVTPEVRSAFRDPVGHFRAVSRRCPFSGMRRWLDAAVASGGSELRLHRGSASAWAAARFKLTPPAPSLGAEVSPAKAGRRAGLPPQLADFYALVDAVDWNGFSCSGGLSGRDDGFAPLSAYRFDFHGDTVDLDRSFVWGTAASGDMLVFTLDGRGGWLSLGGHEIRLLGSVANTTDWVFNELLEGRSPAFPGP